MKPNKRRDAKAAKNRKGGITIGLNPIGGDIRDIIAVSNDLQEYQRCASAFYGSLRYSDPVCFVPVCRPSSRPPEAAERLERMGLKDVALENRLEVRAAATEADDHEIVLIGAVGKSWWDDSGITEQEFRNALKSIPKGKRVTVTVNSEGGSVKEGLGIYNAIDERKADIQVRVAGYALSIASVFPLAAKRTRGGRGVVSPKAAIWMEHKAWSWAQGNADDMRQAADMLEAHDETLVDIYAAATGKDKATIRSRMEKETWTKGADAVTAGLADETDADQKDNSQAAYRPLHPDYIGACKNMSAEILNTLRSSTTAKNQTENQTNHNPTHMRKQMEALLNEWGVKFEASATDEQIVALVKAGKPEKQPEAKGKETPANGENDSKVVTLADLRTLLAERDSTTTAAFKRELTVDTTLDRFVLENRLTKEQAAYWKPFAVKDETVLAQLATWPVIEPAAEPVGQEAALNVSASPREIFAGLGKFENRMKAWQKGSNAVTMVHLRDDAIARAQFLQKHAAQMMPVMNTNTIDSTLKRSVILQSVIKDFIRKVIPLRMFSTVFQSVPLEGTDKVQVPFYDLATDASVAFVSGTGYTTIRDTTTDNREITVGEGATDGDRLYQALSFSSQEFARQPWLKIRDLAQLKVEKLGSDIVADVLSVVTAANYGAAAKTSAADQFDSDDVIDVKLACKLWPDTGRSLLLDSAYDAALLKDPAFKSAFAAASDSAIKEGKLFPRVFGFDYSEWPTIPSNAENLVGFAAFQSAILVAFAPVPPVEEVRNAGTTYQLIIDPDTGITLEFRQFGNNVTDAATNVVESSYGWAKGNGNALKRIVSAAV